MSESRACAHPGCAGSARKGSDYCCNAHKQAAYRKRNKQPVTEPSVTADPVTEELGGTIGPTDGRSSSTGDPRDTESGGASDIHGDQQKALRLARDERGETSDFMGKPYDDLRQPSPLEDVETGPDTAGTSQCYKDSGISLPGDPGYKGVCVQLQGGTVQTDGKWVLDPDRKRLTLPEMQKRHAHV